MVFRFKQFAYLKKKGISVLVSCQDDHLTLRDCVESFLAFGDEIIVITNQATPETLELASALARELAPKVVHVCADEARDLYENRQAGLEHAKYRWVMRCDADYIAYGDEDGRQSISGLRERILEEVAIWPTAFFMTKVSLSMGWGSMYEGNEDDADRLDYIPSVFTGKKEPRIYLQNPFLEFARLGRWEGVPGVRWYRKLYVSAPYWFEITIRSAKSLLFRKARTDWRELGEMQQYPSLQDYVERVLIPDEYDGLTIDQAAQTYIENEVMSRIVPYDEDKYFRLPERIKQKVDRE